MQSIPEMIRVAIYAINGAFLSIPWYCIVIPLAIAVGLVVWLVIREKNKTK